MDKMIKGCISIVAVVMMVVWLGQGNTLSAMPLETGNIPTKHEKSIENSSKRYVKESMSYLQRIQGRGVNIFPVIDSIFSEEGIPNDLKYLAVIESALVPTAMSPSGALGIWQFIKPTAKEYDLKINSRVDERKDLNKSSRAAAQYLKKWNEYFGDWLLAIAAYNCGPYKVIQAQKESGKTSFWDIKEYLPIETQKYVPAFLGIRHCFINNEIAPNAKYITRSTDKSGKLVISKPQNLKKLVNNIDVEWAVVKAMNPHILGKSLQASDLPVQIYLPEDWWKPNAVSNSKNKKYKKLVEEAFYNNGGKDLITILNKGAYYNWNPNYLVSNGRWMWNGEINKIIIDSANIEDRADNHAQYKINEVSIKEKLEGMIAIERSHITTMQKTIDTSIDNRVEFSPHQFRLGNKVRIAENERIHKEYSSIKKVKLQEYLELSC